MSELCAMSLPAARRLRGLDSRQAERQAEAPVPAGRLGAFSTLESGAGGRGLYR